MTSGLPIPPFSPGRDDVDTIHSLSLRIREEGNVSPILDAIPDPVLLLNRYRQIVFGNAAFTSLAAENGCSDPVGMRPGEFFVCEHLADSLEGCGSTEHCTTCGATWVLLEAFKGGQASGECRLLIRGRHGMEAMEMRLTCTPFPWKEESLFLLVMRDISHQKRLVFFERIFLHDLLNTVSAISSMAELMASEMTHYADLKHDLLDTVHFLVGEIASHRQLITAEANELSVSHSLLAPRLVLEHVAATCRNLDVARGKEMHFDISDEDILFTSDETLLCRVLVNLGKNALEATSPGGRVTLGCRQEMKRLVFWCHNPSIIPREVQLQLFHRSFSTKGEGRGIGTYSVKLLTERYLKGEVWFESCEEAGTTFSVAIPVSLV